MLGSQLEVPVGQQPLGERQLVVHSAEDLSVVLRTCCTWFEELSLKQIGLQALPP